MTQEHKRHQSFPLRLPLKIWQRANDLVDREGLSLNHFIGLAVAEKISRLDQGQFWASTKELARLVSSVSRPKSTNATGSHGRPLLTAREQQVLHLLADGRSNYELATVLKVSKHTIKNHLFSNPRPEVPPVIATRLRGNGLNGWSSARPAYNLGGFASKWRCRVGAPVL